MPYKLSGTKVVKSDSGEVVKDHPTREKALAHLRALKANVEESAPAVLGALLEGFDEGRHPRDFHGRFRVGDRVTFHKAGAKQPGVHEVVGLRPNGVLRIKHPDGSTDDVHHTHVERVGPVSSSRGRALAQRELERLRGAQTPRPRIRESAPEVLGALLEGR